MKLKFKTRKEKYILFFLLFLVICLGIFIFGLKINQESVVGLIERAGFWAPSVYVTIMASTFVIAPLSGTPIYLAGYLLFENKVQIYTYLAVLLAAVMNFWIARKWGRGLVFKLVGKRNINKIDQFTGDYGIKSLILLRLFQGHLHDFISFAYGLTNINFLPYITVSIFAPIPWLILWQLYLFKRIENFGEFTIWWLITLIPLFVVSFLFASKMRRKKKI